MLIAGDNCDIRAFVVGDYRFSSSQSSTVTVNVQPIPTKLSLFMTAKDDVEGYTVYRWLKHEKGNSLQGMPVTIWTGGYVMHATGQISYRYYQDVTTDTSGYFELRIRWYVDQGGVGTQASYAAFHENGAYPQYSSASSDMVWAYVG